MVVTLFFSFAMQDGLHSTPMGDIPLRMPNLRGLVERGTRFTQAYVPSPLCAPSRSCLAAAREYDATGVPSNDFDFPTNVTTFYSVLRQAGYHTMVSGKDDLTKKSQLGYRTGYPGCPFCHDGDGLYRLEELGFTDGLRYSGKEDVVDTPAPHEMYGFFLRNQTMLSQRSTMVNAWDAHRTCMGQHGNSSALCDASTYTAAVYEDDFTANNSLTLLRRRPTNRPFFLQINFPGPHPPFVVTAPMHDSASDGRVWPMAVDDKGHITPGGTCVVTHEPDTSRRRCNYAAELENLDRLFGLILTELDVQNITAQTIVCVSSDHGKSYTFICRRDKRDKQSANMRKSLGWEGR